MSLCDFLLFTTLMFTHEINRIYHMDRPGRSVGNDPALLVEGCGLDSYT